MQRAYPWPVRWRKKPTPTPESSCGRCGYSVTGLAAMTCPECGSDLREVGIKTNASTKCPVPTLWRRLGAAAFLFFLIKGLLWLLLPALVATGFIKAF